MLERRPVSHSGRQGGGRDVCTLLPSTYGFSHCSVQSPNCNCPLNQCHCRVTGQQEQAVECKLYGRKLTPQIIALFCYPLSITSHFCSRSVGTPQISRVGAIVYVKVHTECAGCYGARLYRSPAHGGMWQRCTHLGTRDNCKRAESCAQKLGASCARQLCAHGGPCRPECLSAACPANRLG